MSLPSTSRLDGQASMSNPDPLQPATTPESSIATPTTPILTSRSDEMLASKSSSWKGKEREKGLERTALLSDEQQRRGAGQNKVVVTPPKGWLHFVAGGVGGMCGAIITSPLDVVKTRLQSDLFKQKLQSSAAPIPNSGIFATSRRLAWHFVETANLLGEISTKEGTRALFKGLGPTLVGVVPARSINFYTYGNGKAILADRFNDGKQNAAVHLVAAAFAGLVTATATNPIWVVKTRLQLNSHAIEAAASDRRKASVGRIANSNSVSSSTNPGCGALKPSAQAQSPASSSVLRSPSSAPTSTFFKPKPMPRAPALNAIKTAGLILKTEGVQGLYKGLSASYLGVAEGTIQWVLYERLKRLGVEDNTDVARGGVREWMGTIGAAGIAKATASLITYPHEVVRTRLRQQPAAGQSARYTGLLQTIQLVLKEEGAAALYGGLSAHLLRVVPNAAVMFSIYELALRLGAGPAAIVPTPDSSDDLSSSKDTERLV